MIFPGTSKTVLLLLFALVCSVCCSRSPGNSEMKQGEVLPASEMKEKYQLTADNAPVLKLDATRVPHDLADLIPLAEKWGISDDIIRDDFQSKATAAEKQALADALAGRNARITEWQDSLPEGAPMTDEAAAFMYMQVALDEMGLWRD